MCRPYRTSSWVLHWNRWWSRCTEFFAPTKDLCWTCSHINLCRSFGIIRIDCGIDLKHASRSSTMLNKIICRVISNHAFPDWAFGRRTRGNSGGQLSFANLNVFASLFVMPRFSLSDSERATILHPTVLNSSIALHISLWFDLGMYLFGLSCKSWASWLISTVKSSSIRHNTNK